jgi:hypothetical protein
VDKNVVLIMDKSLFKSYVIDYKQNIIRDMEQSLHDYEGAANMDETETNDPEDFSHQDESEDFKKILRGKIDQAKLELAKLEKLNTEELSRMGFGSLVETDKLSFYVSIATLPFTIDGKNCIGISEQAPVFSILRQKKIGDKLKVGNVEYTIRSIA